MRLVSKGTECIINLEDKQNGQLFAKCPIEAFPGVAVEPVADSSRYFVLRIQDDNGEEMWSESFSVSRIDDNRLVF